MKLHGYYFVNVLGDATHSLADVFNPLPRNFVVNTLSTLVTRGCAAARSQHPVTKHGAVRSTRSVADHQPAAGWVFSEILPVYL